MMKKILAFLLSTMIFAGVMTGCGSSAADDTDGNHAAANGNAGTPAPDNSDASPDSVTVSTAYGDVEVPYAPERICVLDLSTMDMIDALGLGDKVVCLQWHKHYPDYLDGYYNSETIISLTGNNGNHGGSQATTDTDEDADPYEIYYGIDADLIIGTTEKIDADLYAVLSQIAPTVALPTALECVENLYSGMRANAEVVAAIWGLDAELENMITPYDEIYAQLCETLSGKNFVMANANTDLNILQIGSAGKSGSQGASSQQTKAASESGNSSEKSGNSNKKSNTANMSTFLTQLGMTEITETVSKDAWVESITAAVEAGTSQEDAAKTVVDAINAANPDSVFVFNYSYGSLEEIREAGFDILSLENLACPVCFVSIELTYTSGGLTAVMSTLDEMANAFLI